RPAVLLGVGEPGETMHHARSGHGDAGAGSAGHVAVGLSRVGSGLLVAHADVGNPFLLRRRGDRGDRETDDPEKVIDALLLEAPRYQGSAVDFTHSFLLVTDDLEPRTCLIDGRDPGPEPAPSPQSIRQCPPRATRQCSGRPCRAMTTTRC